MGGAQQIFASPHIQLFRNDQEEHYFRTFRNETASSLLGLFDTSLWDRTILQASHDEPFIRDGIIAIAAIWTNGRKRVEMCGRCDRGPVVVTQPYQFALQQYGRAVTNFRQSITKDGNTPNLRKTLIGCLLVVCFEALQGNHFEALKNALSGHKLLDDWLARKKHRDSRSEGLTSPAQDVVEDDLVQAFTRMDLQIMTYVDPRPVEMHEGMKNEGTDTVLYMPSCFTSIEEARLYCELIQRRSSHFIATASHKNLSSEAHSGVLVPKTSVDMGTGAALVSYYPESDIFRSWNDALHAEYIQYSSEVTRWFSAFAPLYSSLGPSPAPHSRKWTAATVLQIQAKSTEVMLLCSLAGGGESSPDGFLPELAAIVALCREVSASPFYRASSSFTLDLGIVNPLRMVAKWCRNPVVRREAIHILRETSAREGLYDGLIMASIMQWVMLIEEEAMDQNGYIPECKRAKVTSVKADPWLSQAHLECTRIGLNEDGSQDIRRTVISW